MKRLLFLVGCVGVLIISSCQKQLDASILNGPQDSTTAKLLLSEIYYYGDSSLLIPPTIIQYGYDAQNRCNQIRVLGIDTATRDTVEDQKLVIHYQGNANNPHKVSMEVYGQPYTWFLFYDAGGKKIKDSIIEEFGQRNDQLITYNYQNTIVYVNGRSMQGDSVRMDFDTVYLQQDGIRQLNIKSTLVHFSVPRQFKPTLTITK